MSIPKVELPIVVADVPEALKRLREHANALAWELDETRAIIAIVEKACPHTDARTWSTGDGDGSVGFACPHCGTVGER